MTFLVKIFLNPLLRPAFVFAGLVSTLTATAFGSNGPCDILGSTTPCVATYGTVRALYASYSGPLYQVTRQSDGSSTDVGLLSDGYANAATQDSFCSGTSCTFTKLFDQTSNHNDLTLAPPGAADTGAGPNGYDLGAVANALPATAGGHNLYLPSPCVPKSPECSGRAAL